MINKKKVFIVLIIISLIIIATVQITRTLARYETVTTTQRDVDVAFWIVDNDFKSDRILIEEIYPSTTPFEYRFTVSNFNGTKSAETDLEYELTLTTTTNLPLSYVITKNGTTCTKTEELFSDEYGTVYRKIKLETEANNLKMLHENDKTDTFILKATFPEGYSANEQYADLMEDVKIDLTARQVIEEEVANT